MENIQQTAQNPEETIPKKVAAMEVLKELNLRNSLLIGFIGISIVNVVMDNIPSGIFKLLFLFVPFVVFLIMLNLTRKKIDELKKRYDVK